MATKKKTLTTVRKRGESIEIKFGNARCVCGCGEGMHTVALMAGQKCCDKCTGWEEAKDAGE